MDAPHRGPSCAPRNPVTCPAAGAGAHGRRPQAPRPHPFGPSDARRAFLHAPATTCDTRSHMPQRGAPFTAQRTFAGSSLDTVRSVAGAAVVTLGFKVRASSALNVLGYTGWRWTSAFGLGELIEIDLAPQIDHVFVSVTSWQYRRLLFDLADRNQSNVVLVLEIMESELCR